MTGAGSGIETFTGVDMLDPGEGGDVEVVGALTAVAGVAGPAALPQKSLEDVGGVLEVAAKDGTGCRVVKVGRVGICSGGICGGGI